MRETPWGHDITFGEEWENMLFWDNPGVMAQPIGPNRGTLGCLVPVHVNSAPT
jgi:hypothetical protein